MAAIGILIETEDGAVKDANFGVLTAARGAGDNTLVALMLDGSAESAREALEKYGANKVVQLSAAGGDLSANPDLKALITDHGALTSTAGVYLRAAGIKPGQICGAGFDLSAPTAQAIKDGWISVVLDQQPFLQGFLPIMQMYLAKKFGFAGMNVDTGAALITPANVDQVTPLVAKAIR